MGIFMVLGDSGGGKGKKKEEGSGEPQKLVAAEKKEYARYIYCTTTLLLTTSHILYVRVVPRLHFKISKRALFSFSFFAVPDVNLCMGESFSGKKGRKEEEEEAENFTPAV